ncbi:MAG: hypothetical protein ACHQUC_01525 [Chlamydiales bacterium]
MQPYNSHPCLYIKVESKTFVADENSSIDGEYFAWVVDILNTEDHCRSFEDYYSAIKGLPFSYDSLVFKVLCPQENCPIRTNDIVGLYYSTLKGEIEFVENPFRLNIIE